MSIFDSLKKLFGINGSRSQSNASNDQHLDAVDRQTLDLQPYHNPSNDDYYIESDQFFEQGFQQLENFMRNLPMFGFPFGFGPSGPFQNPDPHPSPGPFGGSSTPESGMFPFHGFSGIFGPGESHRGNIGPGGFHQGIFGPGESHRGNIGPGVFHQGIFGPGESHRGNIGPGGFHQGIFGPGESHRGNIGPGGFHQGIFGPTFEGISGEESTNPRDEVLKPSYRSTAQQIRDEDYDDLVKQQGPDVILDMLKKSEESDQHKKMPLVPAPRTDRAPRSMGKFTSTKFSWVNGKSVQEQITSLPDGTFEKKVTTTGPNGETNIVVSQHTAEEVMPQRGGMGGGFFGGGGGFGGSSFW